MNQENKPAGAPVADTTHGRVRGEYIGGAAVFRGIPYGASCAGPGRFMPPQPAKDWEGVRACIHNPPLCWQPGASVGNIPEPPDIITAAAAAEFFTSLCRNTWTRTA